MDILSSHIHGYPILAFVGAKIRVGIGLATQIGMEQGMKITIWSIVSRIFDYKP